MRWPGRRWAGAIARNRSHQRGGRRFSVRGEDGVLLDAWFSPADPGIAKRIPVTFCHGWLEFKELHFPLAERLNQRGHDVVLFDHRGHGRSTGKAPTFGVKERIDLMHVIDAVRSRDMLGDRIATLGFSLGAATVLQHAPTDTRVAGVIAFAPFVNFRAAILSFRDMLTPWMNGDWLMRGFEDATREAGFEIDDASTIEAIRKTHVPVMIVEGSKDTTLPPGVHVRPLEEAKQTGEFRLFTVDGAGHGSLVRKQWPGLNDAVGVFLDSLDAGTGDVRG